MSSIERLRLTGTLALAIAFAGCVGAGNAHEAQPPRHHDFADDDNYDRWDHPEPTTRAPREPGAPATTGPAAPVEPARPDVKLEVIVVDVISWDEVKLRGGVKGSIVRGLVSLTGWLAGLQGETPAKKKDAKDPDDKTPRPTVTLLVPAGRETTIDFAESGLRELAGDWAAIRCSVLDSDQNGNVDLAVDGILPGGESPAPVVPAARIRVTPGEAVVIGGRRSEPEGEAPPGADAKKPRDQLALLKATIVQPKKTTRKPE